MHIWNSLEKKVVNTNAQVFFFFLQYSRSDSNEQLYLKTTGLNDDFLHLFSLFHLFYFIFSGLISFSICFPVSLTLFLLCFLKPLSSVVKKFCTYIYIYIYVCMCMYIYIYIGFPGGSEVKASAYTVGDPGSSPGSGRSPGERNGNPLQYSCLEKPMEGGARQATVHGVPKSQTLLSD